MNLWKPQHHLGIFKTWFEQCVRQTNNFHRGANHTLTLKRGLLPTKAVDKDTDILWSPTSRTSNWFFKSRAAPLQQQSRTFSYGILKGLSGVVMVLFSNERSLGCPVSSDVSGGESLVVQGLMHLCGWIKLLEHHNKKRRQKYNEH